MKTPQTVALLLIAGLLAATPGCTPAGTRGAGGETKTQSFGGAGGGTRANYYGRDGMLGTTGANPNFPTSPTYHNYRADLTMIRESLRNIKGLSDVHVAFHGPNAVIRGTLPSGTSEQEIAKREAEASEAAYRMVPRYHFRSDFRAR
ncbi:hypothetical protein J31TS4_35780 [Paenibacillus sp. J31TS4]|uniref:hypothetical protein n=1 Tax=Paenibacillus sp. J31TS4 TaxID=2807195 RepID=UPI001B2CB627|nr:hypothetical protein [Paenibacillus sp. J31TS4]GIP40298.1 hypothetical protein J31TS4_35780 [Paenibacillus sp. J31TS4]